MTSEEEMRKVFDSFDRNGDGFLDMDELVVVLKEVSKQGSTKNIETEIRSYLDKYDSDGDGMLEFSEFHNMVADNVAHFKLLSPKTMTPRNTSGSTSGRLPLPPLRSQQEYTDLETFRTALKAARVRLPRDEWLLVSFLRARGSEEKGRDIPASVEMLKKHLEWRHSFGADTILSDFSFPEMTQVNELYQVGLYHTTMEGHPVYIERLGNLDIKELLKVSTIERLEQLHVQIKEDILQNKLTACSLAQGERVTQLFSVLDMKGFSMMRMGAVKDFLVTIMKLDQDNYPETLFKMVIVNAPRMFSMAWGAIKSFLDPNVQAKIVIKSNNGIDELTKYINRDHIPDFLGGSGPSADWPEVQPGPWQHHPQTSLISPWLDYQNDLEAALMDSLDADTARVRSLSGDLSRLADEKSLRTPPATREHAPSVVRLGGPLGALAIEQCAAHSAQDVIGGPDALLRISLCRRRGTKSNVPVLSEVRNGACQTTMIIDTDEWAEVYA